jgi:SWI/SNF-related matrix-associated actin-dependent regulator 1 of chromatin subfamily A
MFIEHLSADARQAAEGSQSAFEQSRAASADLKVPAPPGLTYFKYQLAGVRWCLDRPSVLLADEPGLGKTIQIIGMINHNEEMQRTLVICPASLTLNWRDEAKRWLTRPTEIRVLEQAADIPMFKDHDNILAITNFEMLIRQRGNKLYDALLRRAWDLIAVDEAHRLCNQHDAKIAQAVLGTPPKRKEDGGPMSEEIPGLLDRASRKILATGTPFRNRPRELWPLVHALDPTHFDSEYHFLTRYCGAEEHRVGKRRVHKYDGASNLEELQDRLRSKANYGKGLMIRRLKVDVLPDMPAKIRQVVALPVPRSAARLVTIEIKEVTKDADSIIEASLATADMLALRGLYQEYSESVGKLHSAGSIAFDRMAAVRHEVGLAKVPVVLDHVTNMLEGGLEALIIFAHHSDVVDKLMEGLAKYNPVRITGRESKKKKHAAVAKFQTDKTCRVVIANIRAAGEGITLTRASTVVFAELSFVPGEMQQGEDRAHRIGQHNSVLVQHLVFDGSVDQRIVEILVEKSSIADATFDASRSNEMTSSKLREAAEQRMKMRYPDLVRQAATRAVARVTTWKPSWLAVGGWLAAQNELNDRQCDIALRALQHHMEHIPARLCAKLCLGFDKKKTTRNNEGESACTNSS